MHYIIRFLLSGLVSKFAANRGRNWIVWFILSIFSSPLVTFLILLLLKNLKVIKETNTKKSREIKEKLILEQKEN